MMQLPLSIAALFDKWASSVSPYLNNIATKSSLLQAVLQMKPTSTLCTPNNKASLQTSKEPSIPWYNHPLIYLLTLSAVPSVPLLCGLLILSNTLSLLPLLQVNIFILAPIIFLLLVSVVDYVFESHAEVLHFGDEGQKESAVRQVFEEQKLSLRERNERQYSNYDQLRVQKQLDKSYCRVLQFYTLYHVAVYTFCFYVVYKKNYTVYSLDFWIVAFSIGMFGTNPGAATAHELVHKLNGWESFCGKFILTLFQYTHFFISHVYHHHKYVATPLDPVSARRNESIYGFIPRAIVGGYKVSWEREAERLQLKQLPYWSIHNRMLRYFVADFVLMPLAAYLFFGTIGVQLLFAQSLFAVFMLEATNYLEHYGLERRIIGVDEQNRPIYEAVNDTHSWDGFNVMSAYLSLNINYHAMHHEHPLRLYSNLKPRPTSPRMPCNYQFLFFVSLIPPLFFKIMNGILDAHNKQYKEWQKKYE